MNASPPLTLPHCLVIEPLRNALYPLNGQSNYSRLSTFKLKPTVCVHVQQGHLIHTLFIIMFNNHLVGLSPKWSPLFPDIVRQCCPWPTVKCSALKYRTGCNLGYAVPHLVLKTLIPHRPNRCIINCVVSTLPVFYGNGITHCFLVRALRSI